MVDDQSERHQDRREDPRAAQQDDPKSGKSDDPRVDPHPSAEEPSNDEPATDNRSPNDGAWQNDLTEEDLPAPRQREDTAGNLRLDPT
jgi:hypothetical protein